jgi:starch-binding outer membrane protein, SusD/RagB family
MIVNLHKDKTSFLLAVFYVLFNCTACKKFIAVDLPTTQIVDQTVFANDATAIAAQFGIYANISSSHLAYRVSRYTGLSSDELNAYTDVLSSRELEANALTADNGLVAGLWSDLYKYIYQSNAVIAGVSDNKNISASVAENLKGQAKFTRAFCYFYLVNLYGEVPLILSTDYTVNATATRSSEVAVYDQIILDLTEAAKVLPQDYSGKYPFAIVPSKLSANALLARAYLYAGKWPEADAVATAIIDDPNHAIEPDLNKIFLNTSPEALWQIEPVIPGFNSSEGAYYILNSAPTQDQTTITPAFLGGFEPGDRRKDEWVGLFSDATGDYYFPYKYKVEQNSPDKLEYSVALRLSELYLIRAEARCQQDRLVEAAEDLLVLRQRANLPPLTVTTKEQMLKDILSERRAELFTEWGHRWLDLKRMGFAAEVLQHKTNGWQQTDALYPIPQNDRNNNPNLSQNAGY